MKESRQRSAVTRASQNHWQRLSRLAVCTELLSARYSFRKGAYRRSEQQQAPVAESLRTSACKAWRGGNGLSKPPTYTIELA